MIHGVQHKAVDALSRHPTGPTNPEIFPLHDDKATIGTSTHLPPASLIGRSFLASICTEEQSQDSCSYSIDDGLVSLALSTFSTTAVTWVGVQLKTTNHPDLHTFFTIIEWGFPELQHELPRSTGILQVPPAPLYYRLCCPLQGSHHDTPLSLWDDTDNTTSCPPRVTSMTARAKPTVLWPGITPAVKVLHERCSRCNCVTPSHPRAPSYPPTQHC